MAADVSIPFFQSTGLITSRCMFATTMMPTFPIVSVKHLWYLFKNISILVSTRPFKLKAGIDGYFSFGSDPTFNKAKWLAVNEPINLHKINVPIGATTLLKLSICGPLRRFHNLVLSMSNITGHEWSTYGENKFLGMMKSFGILEFIFGAKMYIWS